MVMAMPWGRPTGTSLGRLGDVPGTPRGRPRDVPGTSQGCPRDVPFTSPGGPQDVPERPEHGLSLERPERPERLEHVRNVWNNVPGQHRLHGAPWRHWSSHSHFKAHPLVCLTALGGFLDDEINA